MDATTRVVQAAWGRPRRVASFGTFDWSGASAEVVTDAGELARARRAFDVAVVELPDADGEAEARMQRATAAVHEGGHVLVVVPRRLGFVEGQKLRRAFDRSAERAVQAAERVGLQVMRVDVRNGHGVVVARVKPEPGKLSLTIGMLTLNEEQSVERMIDEIRQHAPDAGILLIDSSSDATPDLAKAKGADVVRQLPARGHGPAMEQLMYRAADRTDALVYLDCDFTYPSEYIPRILRLLEEGADIVNATRTHKYPKAMPVPNFIANRVFAGTAQIVHGIPTTDLHSGMRGYRSSVIRAFAFDGEQDALPVTTLIAPARSGYSVVDLPIPYAEREGISKLARLRGTAWTFARVATSIGHGRRVTRNHNYSHVER